MNHPAELRLPVPLKGEGRHRLRLDLQGAVQGVGFRPYCHRLAVELDLSGSVCNTPQGAVLEVEGRLAALEEFLRRFSLELPPLCSLDSAEVRETGTTSSTGFLILESGLSGPVTAVALPDAAVCPDCLREIRDCSDRRYRYPFTNCTHCGPRFSILRGFPYDRARTSMASFPMCASCSEEFADPSNRRFHAQPIACPDCGPRAFFWGPDGTVLSESDDAVRMAGAALAAGHLVAVKGLGGFQLMCDARNPGSVARLRLRKHREEKPLAVMFPSLKSLRLECLVSPVEERVLASPAGPIVLLPKRTVRPRPGGICSGVAPGNPSLGAFLPTTPLHALLLDDLGFPLVATSGNLTDEPICVDEREALERLRGVADFFLVHNRPVVRAVDDSVTRMAAGRLMVLRRARGYAPRPLLLPDEKNGPAILALGGHLKNTVALMDGPRVVIGQHLGDLETPTAFEAFKRSVDDLPKLYGVRPEAVACDAHPDYGSTRHAPTLGLRVWPVQHHAAHVASCAAENGITAECLGVAWDGSGWGTDGTLWGGEFFTGRGGTWNRRGRFRTFSLPGGEAAVREPRRCALGVLYEIMGDRLLERADLQSVQAFEGSELRTLVTMMKSKLRCPRTSSAGRLFDAVASLLGLRQRLGFEGQAAMALEFEAGEGSRLDPYGIVWRDGGELGILDWGITIEEILNDMAKRVSPNEIAEKFHGALVEGVIKAARALGQNRVVLGGGCFQNKRLLEGAVNRLREEGLEPYWPVDLPPNDGGLALGQAVIAREQLG